MTQTQQNHPTMHGPEGAPVAPVVQEATVPLTPEQKSAAERHNIPEKLEALLPSLQDPMEAGGRIAALDRLNIGHENAYTKAYNDVYNGQYAYMITIRGKSTAEAHKLATHYVKGAAGQQAIDGAAAMAINQDVHAIIPEFMQGIGEDDPAYEEEYNKVHQALYNVATMQADQWLDKQDDDGNTTEEGVMAGLVNFAHDPDNQGKSAVPAATPIPQPAADQATQPTQYPNPYGPDGGPAPVPVPPEQTPPASTDQLPTGPETQPDNEQKERLDSALEREKDMNEILQRVSERKINASVDRQRVIFFGKTKAEQEYQDATREYAMALANYQSAVVERMRAEGLSSEDINKELVDFTNEVTKSNQETEHRMLLEKGGMFARMLEKYAGASTKKKILIGLAGGVGLAALGAGVGAAAGVVGAGAAAAGVFAGAGRFVRTFAVGLSKMYGPKGELPLFNLANLDQHANEQVVHESRRFIVGQTDKAIEQGDKIKRRAVIGAVGAVALGSTLGIAASHAGDYVSDTKAGYSFGAIGDSIAGPSGPVHPVESGSDLNPGASMPDVESATQTTQMNEFLATHPDAAKYFTADTLKNGITLDVRPGDGTIRLAERYGVSREALETVLRQDPAFKGQTYFENGEMRLNLKDIHFTPSQALKLVNTEMTLRPR